MILKRNKPNKALKIGLASLAVFVLFGGFAVYADSNISQDKTDFRFSHVEGRKDFEIRENPEMEFEFRKDKGFFGNIGGGIKVLFSQKDEYENLQIETYVTDKNEKVVDIFTPEVTKDKNGKFKVTVKKVVENITPGKYVLHFDIKDEQLTGGQALNYFQDFTWGVLAINFNKSVYLENEEAYIQIAVLDETGSTICDADLTLEIDAPGILGGGSLSTEKQTIVSNPKCGPNNVIDEPDYYAHFKLQRLGVYNFKLTAKTKNGEYAITDSVEVKDNLLFEIERIGPTRIYPRANYDMTIKVKANEDFEGNIIETVPKNFIISNFEFRISNEILNSNFETQIIDSKQKIVLKDIKINKGDQIEIIYEIDAPNISPEFYLIGPLEIDSKLEIQNSKFTELRSWQIASDEITETPTRAMLVYGDNTVGTPKYRIWDGAQWGNENSALSVGASAINWVVTKASPNKVEYITATIAADGTVYAQVFKDGSWGDLQYISTVANADYKGLDIAYETSSGEAIVVAADGDADPTYYRWNGSWSGPSTLNLSSTGDNSWIYMASHPTSDEIVIAAMDSSRAYRMQVWNGTTNTWGNEQTPTDLASSPQYPGIAVSYKTTSGEAVVVTADSTAGNTYINTWNGSIWSETLDAGIGNDFYFGTLKSDPSSNILSLSSIDTDNDMTGTYYNGTTWNWTEINVSGNADTDRCVDSIFETSSGREGYIMTVYSTTNILYYAYNDGGAWYTDNVINGGPYSHTIQLDRTGDGIILGLFFDEANLDYVSSYWNGSSWSPIVQLENSPSRTSSPYHEPFMMAAARYAVPTPKEPTFYNTGDTQIGFNNIRQATTTPTFRVSTLSNDSFDSWQIQIAPTNDFLIPVSQIFTGTYASGTIYDLLCDQLAWTPTAEETYFVRARAATSTNWGDWSTETWTFTYSGESESTSTPEWYQNISGQFDNDILLYAESTSSDAVWLPKAGTTTVVFSGNGQETWNVPYGVTKVEVKVWGAGGGGGGGDQNSVSAKGGDGGGGGFAGGTVSVVSGETLTIDVGEGGYGGPGGANQGGGGGGGAGYTAVSNSSEYLFIAGAGGGGGGGDDNTAGPGGGGGAGGGTTGAAGGSAAGGNAPGGTGGTQVSGGIGGNGTNYDGSDGTSLAGGAGGGEAFAVAGGVGGLLGGANGGGDSNDGQDMGGGGGGGAGYFGGGGGANSNAVSPQGAAGGGGGSSYVISNAVATTTVAGSNATPANNTDPDYGSDSAGVGGAGSALDATAGDDGSSGRVVIKYYLDYTSGVVMTNPIDYDSAYSMKKWNEAIWHTTETEGDIKIQVWYASTSPEGSACDTIVPDSDLAGNSTGFDVSASPLDLHNLSTTIYNRICLRATLTKGATISPTLNDWKVTWLPGPRIESVSIPSEMYAIGDTLTATITVLASSDVYTLGTTTINEVTIASTSLTKINDTTYVVDYIINEGDTDRTAGNIPISIRLTDSANDIVSDPFTTPETNTASIDAHPPVIQAVYISNGDYKIGDSFNVLIDADSAGYTESAITVNGKAVTGFHDNGDTTYDVTYTVVEEDTDRPDGTIPVSIVLADSYGNTNSAYTSTETNTASIDANKPVVTKIELPNIVYKIGDTVTATITIEADLDYVNYTLATTSINWATSTTGNLSKISSTTLTISYTVLENDYDQTAGNIPVYVSFVDGAGNYGSIYNTVEPNTASIDAHKPTITSVSFVPDSGILKIGDFATSTITAGGSETGLSVVTATINGVDVSSTFVDIGSGNYRVVYTVLENNTDHPDGDDLPVNFKIRDAAGNESATYATADPTNRPGVDGHRPIISGVTFIPTSGVLRIGDTATATITADAAGYTAGIMTINGVDVSSTLVPGAGNTYIVTYTVVEGNNDVLDALDLPISIGLIDTAGNESSPYQTPDSGNRPGVDANTPSIANVSFLPTSGVLKVGGTATATITVANSETGLNAGTTMTINGVDVSSTFTEIGGGDYLVVYTVAEGNTDILDSEDLPVDFNIIDDAGNVSASYTTSDSGNRPGVDAHVPIISNVTFTPSSGVLKVGDTATSTITSDGINYSVGTITINGVDVSASLIDNANNTYTVTYIVSEGDTDIPDANDLPVNISLIDLAGNESLEYSVSDAGNRPGVDAHLPTTPGPLSLNTKHTNSLVINLGATTTEDNFKEYKIFYKAGSSGVTENDTEFNSLDDPSLGDILFLENSTITISGLDAGTEYVLNIWAYDDAGNKKSGVEFSTFTNYIPGNPSSPLQNKNDGVTAVSNNGWTNEDNIKLKASAKDSDTSEVITLYFEMIPIASTSLSSETVPAGACAFNEDYEVCDSKVWSITSSAGNYSVTPYTGEVNPTNIPDSLSGYKWQVIACDDDNVCSGWTSGQQFKVDTVNPSAPGNLTEFNTTTISTTLTFGATTTEDNFKEYKIFYKEGTSGVTENDLEWNQVNDLNLGNILFNNATSTFIDTLSADKTFVFNIWAYDFAGNKANATEMTVTTASASNPPTGIFNSVAQKTDGSGAVDISIEVDDPDNDNTVRAQIEFEAGISCSFSSASQLTIDSNPAKVSDDYGYKPGIDNDHTYQIGTSTGWIWTSPGSNTINFDWLSQTDLPDITGTYCLRLTVNDGTFSQTIPATTTVYIDNTKPSTPGPLSLNTKETYALTLNLGATSVEDNFDYYKIYYKAGDSGVTEADAEHVDADLGDQLFNNTSTTTISGLSAGIEYVFNIWAYDIYGNKATGTEASFTTNYIPENPSSAMQFKNDGLTSIANGSWTEEDNIKLQASAQDSDTSEVISLYFEIATSTDSYVGDTVSACSASAAWESCSSKIWMVTSAPGDYSVTPYTGLVNPTEIPDSSVGYKWRVKACDDNNVCSSWVEYNASTPNFKVDHTPPAAPGNLSFNSRTYNSITLNFGDSTTENNFREYKIYYKAGSSGVVETDTLHGSTTDGNLAYQNYNLAETTQISGLLENTEYVFNIWAYDEVGNKSSATEVSYYTNNRPTGTFSSSSFRTNGTGVADISILVNDTNSDNSRAKIEYVSGADCNFSTPLDPTLDQTDANATSTLGDAKVLNSNEYQIGNSSGWILTSSPNNVNFDWLSQSNIDGQEGFYCLRLTANDNIDDQAVLATTTIYVDNLDPSAPGALTLSSKTGTSITLAFGATTTESNFAYYKIFYKLGASTVTVNDTPHIDSDLNNILYNGTATTTISGLLNNQQYSFRIFAYDTYGNITASNQTTYTTNALPTGVFNSVAQKTDGSGVVDISIEVYDVNGDPCTAKIEFATGTSCNFSSPGDPTLDENQSNISSDYGLVGIENDNAYQVGTSTGKIITSSGSNTINLDWLAANDLPSADDSYCLALTVNDGFDNQLLVATSTLTLDMVDPTPPGNLIASSVTGISITAQFGNETVDKNFSEYKIFYKEGSSGVSELDTEINKYNDSSLGSIDYSGAATITETGLSGDTQYVFNIWAYDLYGNKSSSTIEMSTTTAFILSATWRELEDVIDPTAGNYLGKGQNVRLRLAVTNTGDWVATNTIYSLEYGVIDGSCAAVSTWIGVPVSASTEHFEMVDSLYFTNLYPTTQKFTNSEGYDYVPGQMVKLPTSTTTGITLNGGEYTEIEYTVAANSNSVSGETYCFRALADGDVLDQYSVYPEITLSPPPTGVFNSVSQKTDGSNVVDLSIEVEDLSGDPSKAKIEYVQGNDCNFGVPLKPTLDTLDANTTADFGDPDIDNNSDYQVGTTSAMIITEYGSNTVNFDWNTNADLTDADDVYCLRLTVNDGFDDQLVQATTTTVVDHINPTTPGNLTKIDITSNSVVLGLGTSSSDTHFSEYRIYYREGDSGVTESDTLWSSSSDPNLAFSNYNGATTTTVTGLETNKQYVFKIWAYDSVGNKAFSSEELVVVIRYVSVSENWRWYFDEFNETPTTTIAAENTAPTNVINGDIIKLRLALREIENITGQNIKIRLQYSTFSDFSSDVHFVGEQDDLSALWTYGDGVDVDNDPVLNPLLSGISLGATHNESGISASDYDHLNQQAAEWEFTIRNNGASEYVAYYFRAYDNTNAVVIDKNTGFSFPSLVTESGSITYSVSGFSSGSETEGVITNISTQAGSVPFGTLLSGTEAIGAQRFTIDANAGSGYQLFVYQRSNLISNNGADIDPVPGTNESPIGWPASPYPSAFGYHTGDDTLSGASPSRFSADNTYAQFESNIKEVSYSPIPVAGEVVDLVFRAEISQMQEAGDYETGIVYILVPIFY